jgi:hypothetical protein
VRTGRKDELLKLKGVGWCLTPGEEAPHLQEILFKILPWNRFLRGTSSTSLLLLGFQTSGKNGTKA